MIHTCMVYGQGGIIFSYGFKRFGYQLASLGYQVTWWMPRKPHLLVDYVDHFIPAEDKVALIGYSLGGNSTAWAAQQIKREIALIVAYDPTVNGPHLSNYVLGKHVERAICYRQVGHLITSAWFGRGCLVGNQVEVVDVHEDHLLVQSDPRLHEMTIQALKGIADDVTA